MVYEFLLDKRNYDNLTYRNKRLASRGIAFKNDKIILIKSDRYGEYKFPGGGINIGETKIEALIREFKEETGIDVLVDSIKEFAVFKEIRKSAIYDEIFDHTSYYYLLDVNNKIGDTNLDDYEKEYGYKLVFVDLNEAINNNQRILDNNDITMCPWVERELIILKKLKEVYNGIHS